MGAGQYPADDGGGDRAIAYEITATSVKAGVQSLKSAGFHSEATGIGHWIPAFAGMTVVKRE